MVGSRLVNRNVVAERGRTSMRLEPELWNALLEICDREDLDLNTIVRRVEAGGHAGGRTSAGGNTGMKPAETACCIARLIKASSSSAPTPVR